MLDIVVDLGPVKDALEGISPDSLLKTQQAVRDAALVAQRLWLSVAGGHAIDFQGRQITLNRRSGAYARSIQDGLEYPADGDVLFGRVSANAEYADAIESGTPAHDMKPGLLGGSRARQGKKGQRYNIIPFRHNTPGQTATARAMPMEVYNQAKRLAFSRNVNDTVNYRERKELNARGKWVLRNRYEWGGRLPETPVGWRSRIQPAGHEYTHTTSIFSGMVRMGQKGHSSYMTFRVVSDNSHPDSWWAPAVEPKPIAAAVAEQIRPQAEAIIRQAFEDDLSALTTG